MKFNILALHFLTAILLDHMDHLANHMANKLNRIQNSGWFSLAF